MRILLNLLKINCRIIVRFILRVKNLSLKYDKRDTQNKYSRIQIIICSFFKFTTKFVFTCKRVNAEQKSSGLS